MINFRYCVKDVIIGRVFRVSKDNKFEVVAFSNPKSRLCVVNNKTKEAIDFLDPEKRYPYIGEIDGEYVYRKDEIEEDKDYALMMEDATYSTKTKKILIKDLKRKGVI